VVVSARRSRGRPRRVDFLRWRSTKAAGCRGADVVNLFHFLTGRSLKRDYRKLLVAPVNMRQRFLALIERDREHAARRPARIIARMNHRGDRAVCEALRRASGGVDIDLTVRLHFLDFLPDGGIRQGQEVNSF
jgi:hypothetical protein